MSGRQLGLGKLRQWAGEVISTTKDKAIVTDEFTELEQDIELRKEGATRLHGACEAYQRALCKKKFSEAAGSDKMIPIDALGMVMTSHGEQFPEDSQFGNSLVNLGRAHSTVAELQQTFGHQFKDTFIAAIEQFKEEIKEYEGLRKQLDTRRGALESATTKFEKSRNSKKEKDRREAEDDLERAQQRYDETIEDMRAHMESLQEQEITQERALSAFLDLEINFVQQYLDVLKGVRANWASSSPSSMRQSKSSRSRASMTPVLPPRTTTPAAAESSEDEGYRPPSRNSLKKHKRSESTSSRPSSRLSRRRTNSSVTSTDKNKLDKEDKPRKLSVAGWATSAVDSISSRNKKSKDTESFSSLGDDLGGAPGGETEKVVEPVPRRLSFSLSRRTSSKRKKSKDNLEAHAPVGPPRLLKPPSLQDKKTVKALYDFQGSTDELTFKAGTDIKVLNEVVDGWWMGEIDGQKGLFPTTHVSNTSPELSPSIPHRPYRADDDDASHDPGHSADGYLASDLEEEFGHQLPLSHSRSPFYAGFNDVASITSDHQTEPDSPKAVKAARRFSDDLDQYLETQAKATPKMRNALLQRDDDGDIASAPLLRSQSEGPPSPVSTLPRKMPPPPPPRRIPGASQASSPAIPERRLGPTTKPIVPPRPVASSSTDSVKLFNPYNPSSFSTTSSANTSSSLLSNSVDGLDYDVSPFESAAELSNTASISKGCGKFTANPFLPKGMCSTCKTFHG